VGAIDSGRPWYSNHTPTSSIAQSIASSSDIYCRPAMLANNFRQAVRIGKEQAFHFALPQPQPVGAEADCFERMLSRREGRLPDRGV